MCPVDIMMRLEPFIGNANRSLDVFKTINEALVTLYSLTNKTIVSSIPTNYSFFNKELSHYAAMAETNSEVARVFHELCETLESASFDSSQQSVIVKEASIVDPIALKMTGPRSTSTSTKVDGCAPSQRTKKVDVFQTDVLHRRKKPQQQAKR